MVALFHAGHAATDIDDNAGALMPEDGRKQPFRVGAGQSELVGVADAGGLDLHHHFTLARSLEPNGGDLKRLSCFDSDGGANFHGAPPCFRLLLRGFGA